MHFRFLGLSPHIRGNGKKRTPSNGDIGSIPAHTGERRAKADQRPGLWVYPRTYGGTSESRGVDTHLPGLSPHIRGNENLPVLRFLPRGSIPAHTGERESVAITVREYRVYPRTYGGTGSGCQPGGSDKGLSPHIYPRTGERQSGQ